MATITIKGFILKTPYGGYTHSVADLSSHGYMIVGEHSIEYEMPADFNPVAAEVATLEKQLKTLADEYHLSTASIRSRIKDLKCISYTEPA